MVALTTDPYTATPTDAHELVRVEDLRVHFPTSGGRLFGRKAGAIRAVDGVSFVIRHGEILGLVGESGSGKSTTGRAVLRLREPTGGKVFFDGVDLSMVRGRQMRLLRRRMQIVFQDPYSSLDPRMRVGSIIAEPIRTHHLLSGAAVNDRVAQLMELVGLDPQYARRYPHQFSGGQRQRIAIARALSLHPDFVVCDEPLSALDVSIQAQVLNLLADLRKRFQLAYLFIAHDLSVVRHISDRVAVMYLGRLVEIGTPSEIFGNAGHPYSRALLSAVPLPDPKTERLRKRVVLVGDIPSPADPPAGCRFHTRCWLYERLDRPAQCRDEDPQLKPWRGNHAVACHYVDQAAGSDIGIAHLNASENRPLGPSVGPPS